MGPEPYPKMRQRDHLIGEITKETFIEKLKEKMDVSKPFVVYGMAAVGKTLCLVLGNYNKVVYAIDRNMNGCKYNNIEIFDANSLIELDKDVNVIIAVNQNTTPIKELLKRNGYTSVLTLEEIVDC